MIKWSPTLKANRRRRSISIGVEAVPRRAYKSLGVASGLFHPCAISSTSRVLRRAWTETV